MSPPSLPTLPKNYTRHFPKVTDTEIIGCIGLENIKFMNRSKIVDETCFIDLNLLFDQGIHKPYNYDPKLKELLVFISQHCDKIHLSDGRNTSLDSARFFCYRGLMTMIATTPYERKEPWKMAVVLFNGDIYLCMRKTEEKMKYEQNQTAEDKLREAWGHKFEQFLLSDSPRSDPTPNVPNNELDEFSCVFKRKINQHTIIYGAEMDGILADSEVSDPPGLNADPQSVIEYLKPLKFVELKTHKDFSLKNSEFSFRAYKAKKIWCQSWLTNVQTIVVGFRNDDGIVKELKTYSLNDIKDMRKFWEPKVCINFLDNFFTYVKQCLNHVITREHGATACNDLQHLPLITMLLEWKPNSHVTMSQDWDYKSDEILPSWYLRSVKDFNQSRPSTTTERNLTRNVHSYNEIRLHDCYNQDRSNFGPQRTRGQQDLSHFGHQRTRGQQDRSHFGHQRTRCRSNLQQTRPYNRGRFY